jgi:hypothetical protein
MTSKLVVHCNGNYRVPVYPNAHSVEDLGTPEYVGPGNNVTKEYVLHGLPAGTLIVVSAEEAYDEAAEKAKAEAELQSDGEDSDPE